MYTVKCLHCQQLRWWERKVIIIVVIAVFSLTQATAGAQKPAVMPAHKTDSLVITGKNCLEKKDLNCARACFTLAFRNGMSKDSMMYFAAEIYLRKLAADTALVFNRGLELRDKFKREHILEQRSRIYASIGLKRQADSLLALSRRGLRSELSLYAYVSRNLVAFDKFLFAPLDLIIEPQNDIDDKGRIGLTYKLAGESGGRYKKIFALLDFNSGLPVPTRYSFDERSDTLLRTLSIHCGLPFLPKSVNGIVGYRMAIHGDGKMDHFDREQLFFFLGKGWFIGASHESKWVHGLGMDETRENLSASWYKKSIRYTFQGDIGISHNFNRTFESKGLKLGYDSVDVKSDAAQNHHYYKDSAFRISYDSKMLDQYWGAQPRMQAFSNPEHDISLSLRSYLQIPVKGWFLCKMTGEIRGVWYPKMVKWYTYGSELELPGLDYDFFGDDYVVFNKVDGKYYLHNDPTSINFNRLNFSPIQLTLHQKRRVECLVSLVFFIEKELKYIGTIYAGGLGMKSFSTLNHNIPLVTFNYGWEFSAGWKKNISFIKK